MWNLRQALSTPASSKGSPNTAYPDIHLSLTHHHNQEGLLKLTLWPDETNLYCYLRWKVTNLLQTDNQWSYAWFLNSQGHCTAWMCGSLRQLACLPHVPVTTGLQIFLSFILRYPAHLVGRTEVKCSTAWKMCFLFWTLLGVSEDSHDSYY